jgi:hypothetical protein
MRNQAINAEPASANAVSRGPNGGYYYPFTHQAAADQSHNPHVDFPGGLDESCRDANGVYTAPGFNLVAEVRNLRSPALEVCGPTRGGYYFLNGVELPSRPLITNIGGSHINKYGYESLAAADKAVIDVLSDVRQFPVASKSLGMLACAAPTKVDLHTLLSTNTDKGLTEGERQAAAKGLVDRQYTPVAEALSRGRFEDVTTDIISPRIAVIVQAMRTLKPGGLFIMRDTTPYDPLIANQLGLKTVMHLPATPTAVEGALSPNEMVFQKTASRS